MTNILEHSLVLAPGDPGVFRTIASPAYDGGGRMFGGWIAAIMLKSVLDDPRAVGTASALTVNFLNPVLPGSNIVLNVQQLGGGRSLGHWRCDLADGAGLLLATATIVLANRKPSDAYCEQSPPDAPPPDGFEPAQLPGGFGARVCVVPLLGMSITKCATTRSLNWEKETSGRAIDAVQIALLADLGAPRVFFISEAPRPSATITLSVYFLATDKEMAACGDDYILSDMIGTRIESATCGSRKDMWSRTGTLLATSEQLSWFR